MRIKSFLARPFAQFVHKGIQRSRRTALQDQQQLMQAMIQQGGKTAYGQSVFLSQVSDYEGYKESVPILDYEGFRPWIERIKSGEANVLWRGRPLYFAKTSGTTSGVKYIPITRDSIPNHIQTARNALLCYMAETGRTEFADGKMIFLSGSPELERVGGIPTGRLSGIVNHHIPAYLRTNQLPSYTTNCIEDWEQKLDRIVEETWNKPMSLISGIPPWMQMYFDALIKKTGKQIGELFPQFQVMVQGGVNFEPYRTRLMESIGRAVDTIELFPASEGFFAFQDTQTEPGLLLNTNSGIFFEFIPLAEIGNPNPRRISLADVRLGEQYALILNSNAGLYGYNIGDTVRFVSIDPYRIVVSGRIKHFISAFGEHVIGEEVEAAMQATASAFGVSVTEFTVAPVVSQGQGQSHHEWWIEFRELPADRAAFIQYLDDRMREKNVYYDDLIKGNILSPLRIRVVQTGGFIEYMRSVGKLGGQNKVPRLSNDRTLVNGLQAWSINE